jgi:uncharacterized protein
VKFIVLTSISFFLGLNLIAQVNTKIERMYSVSVKDNFEIYISTPKKYNANQKYKAVYYCDANLKSGKAIREFIESTRNPKVDSLIFVGIGHIGNFHVLRRRDLIQPLIIKDDTIARNINYGNAENFKRFIETEVIPKIDSQYSTFQDSNAILGHSLGGLFTFFCLFKGDSKFVKFFSLSPALWINKYSIYDFDQTSKNRNNISLYISAGSKETMNHILRGVTDMEKYLRRRNYPNIRFQTVIVEGETHNSQVILSFESIFNEYL